MRNVYSECEASQPPVYCRQTHHRDTPGPTRHSIIACCCGCWCRVRSGSWGAPAVSVVSSPALGSWSVHHHHRYSSTHGSFHSTTFLSGSHLSSIFYQPTSFHCYYSLYIHTHTFRDIRILICIIHPNVIVCSSNICIIIILHSLHF